MQRQFLTVLLATLCVLAPVAAPASEATWIDVRTWAEFSEGHLEGAHHIPFDGIETGISALSLEPDAPIYLYCRSGGRAERARETLERQGYSNVTNVGGLEDARRLADEPAE